MKNKLLIIEDNMAKFFSTKQVIETQLRLQVSVLETTSFKEILEVSNQFSPESIIFCPNGGVLDLLSKMKKKGINRRNTDITLLLSTETDCYFHDKLQHAFGRSFIAKAA